MKPNNNHNKPDLCEEQNMYISYLIDKNLYKRALELKNSRDEWLMEFESQMYREWEERQLGFRLFEEKYKKMTAKP